MEGDITTDVVTIDGVSLPDTQVAISYALDFNNVLGLGYVVDQAPGSSPKNANTSLPYRLAQAGQINSPAYSLWMDDTFAATILFGGVDTTKYSGTLHTFPVPSINGVYYMPGIMVTDLVLQTNVTQRITGLPAFFVLDLGISETYIPNNVFLDLYKQFGVQQKDPKLPYGTIPCDMGESNYSVTFTFSGVDFVVLLSSFIGETGDYGNCELYLRPSGGDWGILGVTFLRNAYFVHDMLHNEVSLGQRDFGPRSNGSNILEISNSTSAIKGAVSVSVTASGTIPTGDRFFWGRAQYPTASTPTPTSTEAGAPLATGNPFALVAGILGAGLMLV
jgi:yapsin 1